MATLQCSCLENPKAGGAWWAAVSGVTHKEGKGWGWVMVMVKSLSSVCLFATPWTVAYQAPPSMGFSRQENWSGLPFPSPGDLP